ncbi:MAG: hypothetical protein WDZ35_10760 [Crocinitomicaceae bacterium]
MTKQFFKRITVVVGLTFLLTACPYQSKVPISDPNETIQSSLLGEWVSASEQEYEYPTFYVIEKHNDTKYKLTEKRYNTSDSVYKDVQYFMHSTTIKDNLFMNVQEAKGGDYSLYLFVQDQNEIVRREVSENIDEQFSSSKDLYKYVKKHMDLSFFYEKSEEKYYKRTIE